jgi:hypothetical protein
MRDPVIAAIGVKALAPSDAAVGLEAAGRIVQPALLRDEVSNPIV